MTAAEPRFFSLSDRVGRLRYFGYTLGAMFCLGLLLVGVYLVCLLLPAALGKLVSAVTFILVKNVMFPMVVFVMSIRRLHDLNFSGWWSLTVLIPFVTLALLFLPGNKEANRFGPPPPPNPPALGLFALALPAVLIGLYLFSLSVNPEAETLPGETDKLRSYSPK